MAAVLTSTLNIHVVFLRAAVQLLLISQIRHFLCDAATRS
jgi:hypothetical protein